MKVMVISPKNKTLFNFRGDLIKSIIDNGHEVIATGPNRDYDDDVQNLGLRFIEIPFSKDNTSIVGDIRYFNGLKKIINEEKPDLVFSYTIKPVIYGSLAAKFLKVNKIYPMVTGLGRVYASESFKAKLLRLLTGKLYKSAFKGCDKIIFQNSDDLGRFVNLNYLPKSKAVRVNGSGVNMDKFKSDKLPEEPIFLMISRIIREKGVFEFAEAARKVKKIFPEARFVLLGGFDESIGAIKPVELEPYIEDGSIEFPGETNNVIPYLKEARVFVLPTYYREGLPRTILEAMSMGKPLITTDWPGCRDAVKNNYNGYLVTPKNSEELVEKILLLINNPKKTNEMGSESLRLCKEKYNVDIVNQDMLKIMGL